MSTSITAPATVQIGRSRLVALVVAVAALAALVTWAVTAFAFEGDSPSAAQSSQAAVVYNPLPPASLHATVTAGPPSTSAAQDARKVASIMSLTPAGLAGGALGTSYALPTAQTGPTTASILASMSPQTRQYTQAIMNLTFAQLAAGAAGQP
jgi:hypothetical protein